MKKFVVALLVLLATNAYAAGDLTVGGKIFLPTPGSVISFPDLTTQGSAGSVTPLTSSATSGTLVLPNGLIVKWGVSPSVNLLAVNNVGCIATVTANFTPFPNGILFATVSGNGNAAIWAVSSKNSSSISANGTNWSAAFLTNSNYNYVAIGY